MNDKPKKRILPRPGKGQSFEQAMKATLEQYDWTFRKLAEAEAREKAERAMKLQGAEPALWEDLG